MKALNISDMAFDAVRKVVEILSHRWTTRIMYAGIGIMAVVSIGLLAMWAVRDHYRLSWNLSQSLPQHLFVIEVGVQPSRGDFVAFKWVADDETPLNPYPYGTTFVKIAEGVAGDMVTQKDREFFVGGKDVGYAKILSKKGYNLELGPVGVIPPDRYYVRGTHRDSLDSRYALVGLVSKENVIGRAVALF